MMLIEKRYFFVRYHFTQQFDEASYEFGSSKQNP